MMPHRLDPTYSTARQRFLDTADTAGARIDSFPHPMKGMEGEELAIDVAQLGDPNACSALMVVSGTDGTAGYAGSALQSWWLDERSSQLTDGAPRVLMVHALNPFGFSWANRANEDNVDLNRNFVDWQNPPSNAGYDELAELLVPTEWTAEVQANTSGELLGYAGHVGLTRMQQIISDGQYSHPKGLFYGGTEPVWSHRWLVDHLPGLVAPASKLGIIDIQRGLAEAGTGRVEVRRANNDPALQRATTWWDDVTTTPDEDPSATPDGEWLSALDELLPDVEITTASLDYSLVDLVTMLQAMRATAWLHSYGEPASAQGAAIREQMRQTFTDDDPAWLFSLIGTFDEVSKAAIAGLSS